MKSFRCWILRISVLAILATFSGGLISAQQAAVTKSDTARVSTKTRETDSDKSKANGKQGHTQSATTKGNGNGNGNNAATIKQVKSARPDMSKSNGARPNIVRPGGSVVPKGKGVPGGVPRPAGK